MPGPGYGESAHRDAMRRAEQDHALHRAARRREPCVRVRRDRPRIHITRMRRYQRLGDRAAGSVDTPQQVGNRARKEACFSGIEKASHGRRPDRGYDMRSHTVT